VDGFFQLSLLKKLLTMNCNNIVNHLSVKMADNDLPESSSFHLLGLSFCKDLSWTDHITSTSKSASMNEAIIHIYKSVIRPSMDYCCHIWAGGPVSTHA